MQSVCWALAPPPCFFCPGSFALADRRWLMGSAASRRRSNPKFPEGALTYKRKGLATAALCSKTVVVTRRPTRHRIESRTDPDQADFGRGLRFRALRKTGRRPISSNQGRRHRHRREAGRGRRSEGTGWNRQHCRHLALDTGWSRSGDHDAEPAGTRREWHRAASNCR